MPEIRVQDEHGNIHVFPDGSTPEMISQAMGLQKPAPAVNYLSPENLNRVKNMNAQPTQFENENHGVMRQFAHGLTKYLPAVGGMAGGVLGAGAGLPSGPGAVATGVGGAALGGGAGESTRQLLDRAMGFNAPQTSMDAAKGIGTEGAKQGAYELGGQGIGILGRKLAPSLARAALKIPKAVESRGAQTGRGILDETTSINPTKVAEQARTKLGELGTAHDTASAPFQIPIAPAQDEVTNTIQRGMVRNNPTELRQLGELRDMVTSQHGPNGEITGALPATIPGPDIRAMRQGVGSWRGNWMSPKSDFVDSAAERVYGKLNEPLHAMVPETKALDQRMSNLIPVARYGEKVGNQAGLGENLMTAKGSGIVNALGALGAATGGPAGAGVGALAGRIIPEIASRPSFRLATARIANSPLTPLLTENGLRLIDASQKKNNEKEGEE